MRLVKGLSEEEAVQIRRVVGEQGPFESVDRLWKRSGVRVAAMKRLAQADAVRIDGAGSPGSAVVAPWAE
jgi:error-prone DNA polymerase